MANKGRRRIIIYILAAIGFVIVALLLSLLAFLTPRDRQVLFSNQHKYLYENIERTYLLSNPGGAAERIIIGLHGFGDSARQFAYYTALHNLAQENTLIVYPNALDPQNDNEERGWNAGFCCGSGWKNNIDDAGYIAALIDSLSDEYGVSSENVFVTGFSNGAFMAQKLAVDYPKKIKAIAVSSGTIGTVGNPLKPKQPVPILLMHGQKDTIVPIDGGVGSSDPDFDWLSFSESRSIWEEVNEQKTQTKTSVYPEDGHTWHDWRLFNFWNKKPQASQEVITFFNQL